MNYLSTQLEKAYKLNQGIKNTIKAVWTDIRESISGTERDFTSERLSRAIFLLSVPMVLEMAMESLFAVVDIFFVSKLGAETVAVVGITESLMTIIYALGIGIGTAATAIISRRTGEKDPQQASRSAGQAIITGSVISFILAVPCMFLYQRILTIMGIDTSSIDKYGSYTMIIMGSNVVIMLLFINNAIFRSSGDAAISMRVLWLANILNIILDPLLIFGLGPIPALGIKKDHLPFRQPGYGRLYHCFADHVLYADAFMGDQQCNGYPGRSEPGGTET